MSVSSVDTMCSSWPSNTVKLASGPAVVTIQALIPNAVATAAAYDIAPPYINDSGAAVGSLKGLLMLEGSAYQCFFFVHYIGCQVPNN